MYFQNYNSRSTMFKRISDLAWFLTTFSAVLPQVFLNLVEVHQCQASAVFCVNNPWTGLLWQSSSLQVAISRPLGTHVLIEGEQWESAESN